MSIHPFKDRKEAGHLLARHLAKELAGPDLIVVSLPRGGVVVGYEIATYLNVPMEILVVRKIGAPDQLELAIGAIASGNFTYLNKELIKILHLSENDVTAVIDRETKELHRREERYQVNRSKLSLAGKKILVVDDGIATGATISVAIEALKQKKPAYIAIAVPIATLKTIELFARKVDRCFALQTPESFNAVGEFYQSFPPVSDDEVVNLLKESRVRLRYEANDISKA
jgi:putative phosphoribosyl transferase